MIQGFASQGTEDVFHSEDTKAARRCLPQKLHKSAKLKMTLLDTAQRVDDLRCPPGNRLELLHGDREGFYSIRINDQWRIVFRWSDGNAMDVEICDYH